jgi:hypothetical protein
MVKRRTTRRKPARRRTSGPGPVGRWWTGIPAERRRRITFGSARVLVAVVLIAAAGVGMYYLRGFVMAQPPYAESIALVELDSRPEWMSDQWAAEICAELSMAAGANSDTFDPDLARRVYAAARGCSWIRRVLEVRVERAPADAADADFSGGRVVVVAEYRQPVAMGVAGSRERFVDVEGVVLPTESARRHTANWHLVRIVGLSRPVAQGRQWPGDDLAAGIRVISLLWSKPYYTEIQAVDVSNFGRRHDRSAPSIQLTAFRDDRMTEIRFGDLPVDNLPAVGAPSVRRKLGYLDGWYVHNACRLAGPRYLDLRFPDQIGYPSSYSPAYQ